jgi:hypothetical protein
MPVQPVRGIYWLHGDPVLAAFALTDRDAGVAEIDVFDTQTNALH